MRRTDVPLAIAVAAAVVASVLAAVSLAQDGLPEPAREAIELADYVPANALIYVHVALDRERDPVRRLADEAERFPGYVGLRNRVVRELASPDCQRASDALEAGGDAALALFESQRGRSLSLLLIDQRGPRPSADLRRCGALFAANVGDVLVIGQRQALSTAVALHAGRETSLSENELAATQRRRLPAERALDGWLSVDGVRRLLAPQRGILGFVGVTVDQPALRGLAFSVGASTSGMGVALRSALGPRRTPPTASAEALSAIARRAPDDAMVAFVAPRVGTALGRVSGALGGTGGVSILAGLPKEVIALFNRPTVTVLQSARPAPVLTLITTTEDEAGAKRALAGIPARLRRAIPSGVKDGYVVLSTRRAGLSLLNAPADALPAASTWQSVIGGEGPKAGSSLLFLDFSKLLALAEQTGLGTDPSYQAVRADLGRITAAGARITSSARASTVDVDLLIP